MSNTFLTFFGCCTGKSNQRDKKPVAALLLCPTSSMNIQNPPNRPLNSMFDNIHTLNADDLDLQDDFGNRRSSRSLLHAQPFNEVFIFGNKYKIVAFITRKKIAKESSMQVSFRESLSSLMKENGKNNSNSNTSSKVKWSNLVKNCASLDNKKDLSAKDDRATSSNASYNGHSTDLGAHLANRLRCDIIVDAFCGSGEITKQFGCTCMHVIAMEKDMEKLLTAKSLAETDKVSHKIDFMNVEFLNTQNIKADIVFLEPVDVRKTLDGQGFSIFEDLQPDIESIVKKALEMSNGHVVLKLPSDTSLEEISKLFHSTIDESSIGAKRYCIDVEEIINNNQEVEHIIVYFGECSSVENSEQYHALYDYLSSNQQPKWRFKFNLQVVTGLLEKVGIKRSLRYITEIEETLAKNIQLPYSFFDTFLEKAINDNVITRHEIAQMIKEESKRPSSFIFSYANSYTSNFTLLQRSSSAISSQYNLIENVEDNRAKKAPVKANKDDIRNSVSEIPVVYNEYLSQDNSSIQPARGDNIQKSTPIYNGFIRKKPFSFKDIGYNNNSLTSQEFEVSNLDHSMSSDEGDFARGYEENAAYSFSKVSDKKVTLNGETAGNNMLTPEDLEISSPGLFPGYKKGKYPSGTRLSKWRELGNGQIISEGEEQILENKENKVMNRDCGVEEANKPDFFVKKRNVFLEGAAISQEK